MKLEDHVCSLESAKRLEELRVTQDSLFWWTIDEPYELRNLQAWIATSKDPKTNKATMVSAFTVAELGEMLPKEVGYFKNTFGWRVGCDIGMLGVRNERGNYSYNPINFEKKNEAEARAKMLIYLIENKLIEV